jgi:hypothetical protein
VVGEGAAVGCGEVGEEGSAQQIGHGGLSSSQRARPAGALWESE